MKENVCHFWNYGATVCYHVSKDKKNKLEPKNNMGVVIGYIKTQFNYWVYFPSLKVTVVMRDVKFDGEKDMGCSLEWELIIPPREELLDSKKEL